ncbi:MAG: glycosyltransferase [bacterium]|nr:glycosyltransferase [bacterium]
MKVLHLSAAPKKSGAGKAAFLTHKHLRESCIDSKLLYLKESDLDENCYSYEDQSFIHHLKRVVATRLDKKFLSNYSDRQPVLFSPGLRGLSLQKHPLIQWANVIHVHWANHGFIDVTELQKWNKPIVWTLRDMWAFTGGCHYAFECQGYKRSCGECPILGTENQSDLSNRCHQHKETHFRNVEISWVAISNWMKKRALESDILANQEITIIPSGVSSQDFKIGDKHKARKELSIHPDSKVILTGATNLREAYKGFQYSLKALRKIDKNCLVLTYGQTTFDDDEIPQKIKHMGFVKEKKLSQLLAASDLFLAPSVAEAMGKTHLEAQLSGRPVVCFENTGPEDFVKHRQTGYVARYKDYEDLTNGINYCLNYNFNPNDIRQNSLSWDIKEVANLYIDLYEKNMLDWTCH